MLAPDTRISLRKPMSARMNAIIAAMKGGATTAEASKVTKAARNNSAITVEMRSAVRVQSPMERLTTRAHQDRLTSS